MVIIHLVYMVKNLIIYFLNAQGGLESIVKNGYEWLYRCPKPTFWRALTDNDRGSKFHIKSGSWLSADMFIDCKDVQVLWMVKYKNICTR